MAQHNNSFNRTRNSAALKLNLDSSPVNSGVRFLSSMKIKPLTEAEFIGTFSEPMKDVTGEESEPIVDIWPYAEEVFAQELPEIPVDDADVNYVYLSADGKYHHVGIWYAKPNIYLVIVVNLKEASIHGHRILNLNEEYGLS